MHELSYEIKQFSIDDIYIKYKFNIPKFQRGISWDKIRRRKFIETVRNGKPVGVILVHLNAKNEFTLVDGLQRISTLKHYNDHFEEYIEDVINKELISNLFDNFINGHSNINVNKKLKSKDLELFIMNIFKSNNKIGVTELQKKLIDEYELDIVSSEMALNLTGLLEELRADVYQKKDLSPFSIPAIVYKGNEEDLPDIFESINTGSVILTKYEVLAATWSNDTFYVTDKEIIDSIKEKYEALQNKSNIQLEFNIDDIENQINFFEYCYALGNILNKKAYKLFGKNDRPDKTDSLGFDMLCMISGLQVNEAAKLRAKFEKNFEEKFLIDIKNIIVEAAMVVSDTLSDWLVNHNKSEIKYSSHYLFYHMIVAYIKNNYDIDFLNFVIHKKSNNEWNKKFKKYLPHWLINDLVTGFWQRNRQVTDLSRLLNNNEEINKYGNILSRDEWRLNLLNWMNEQNKNSKLIQVKIENKLFLNFMHKINSKDHDYWELFVNENPDLDIEHIVPKHRLEDLKNEVPISSIVNLCYFTKRTNRGKKSKTLHEFLDDRPELKLESKENKKLLEMIDYPCKAELDFLNLGLEDKKEQYYQFLNNRAELLAKKYSEKIFCFFNDSLLHN